jgi:hypothetical protein
MMCSLLGDLSSFFAPQDDVLTFALTNNMPSAIFQRAKSNVLSLMIVNG